MNCNYNDYEKRRCNNPTVERRSWILGQRHRSPSCRLIHYFTFPTLEIERPQPTSRRQIFGIVLLFLLQKKIATDQPPSDPIRRRLHRFDHHGIMVKESANRNIVVRRLSLS